MSHSRGAMLLACGVAVALAAACVLNPQPLPPEADGANPGLADDGGSMTAASDASAPDSMGGTLSDGGTPADATTDADASSDASSDGSSDAASEGATDGASDG